MRSQWASWYSDPLLNLGLKDVQNLDISAKYKKEGWLLRFDAHLEYDVLYDLNDSEFDPVQVEDYRMRYIPGIQSLSQTFQFGKHKFEPFNRQTNRNLGRKRWA